MLSHKRLDDLQHLLTKVKEICDSYEFDSLDAGLFYPFVVSLIALVYGVSSYTHLLVAPGLSLNASCWNLLIMLHVD